MASDIVAQDWGQYVSLWSHQLRSLAPADSEFDEQ